MYISLGSCILKTPVLLLHIDTTTFTTITTATIQFVLVWQMADSEDLDNDIDELLQEFESDKNRPILHTVQFY